MPADVAASFSALSKEQLVEKLEKSEAGRKKLRQAISILQEKVDATEKVLEINESLRKECELERQRAEGEKKKAEEERRLRSMLEKDSASLKDQLAKVLQRLGAVENRQKSDKKEHERIRNEVKLSVEGMHSSAQAMEAMQNLFQTLEGNLYEKVNSAFEEAHTASQAVHSVQTSLQTLERTVMEKVQGLPPDNPAVQSTAKPGMEKLVLDITRLFNKEKQSHSKIEHRLAMLKSAIKSGQNEDYLTSAGLDRLGSSKKKKKDKESKKRKSTDEEILERKARKREKLSEVDISDGHKRANKDHSVGSSFRIEYQKEPGPLSPEAPSFNTASNHYIEETHPEFGGSSDGNTKLQVPPSGLVKDKCDKSAVKKDNTGRVFGESICMQNGGRLAEPEAEHKVMRSKVQEEDLERDQKEDSERCHAKQGDHSYLSLDLLETDDSDDEWWLQDWILLSPSLPEIATPLHCSPSPCRKLDPSSHQRALLTDSHTTCTSTDFQMNSGLDDKMPLNEESVSRAIALRSTNEDQVIMPGDLQLHETSVKQVDESLQRASLVVNDSALQPGVLNVEHNQDHVCGKPKTVNVLSAPESTIFCSADEAYPGLVHTNKPGPEMLSSPDKKEKEFQVDDINDVNIVEINDFLDDLPPIYAFANEHCGAQPSNDVETKTNCSIGPTNDFCVSFLPQVSCDPSKDLDTNPQPSYKLQVNRDVETASKPGGLENGPKSQAVQSLSSTPPFLQSSHTVFLLQAFEFHEIDVKVYVTAACINAIYFKENLPLMNTEKDKLLQEPWLSRAGADVPLEFLACGFISSAVDLVRSESGSDHGSTERKPVHALVQTITAFIGSTYKEKASLMLDAIFVQLRQFLNRGEAMLITLQGLNSPSEDAISIARKLHDKDHFFYQYTQATMEDLNAGGKMISWDMLFVRSS